MYQGPLDQEAAALTERLSPLSSGYSDFRKLTKSAISCGVKLASKRAL